MQEMRSASPPIELSKGYSETSCDDVLLTPNQANRRSSVVGVDVVGVGVVGFGFFVFCFCFFVLENGATIGGQPTGMARHTLTQATFFFFFGGTKTPKKRPQRACACACVCVMYARQYTREVCAVQDNVLEHHIQTYLIDIDDSSIKSQLLVRVRSRTLQGRHRFWRSQNRWMPPKLQWRQHQESKLTTAVCGQMHQKLLQEQLTPAGKSSG